MAEPIAHPKPAVMAVFNEVLSWLWRPVHPCRPWGDLVSIHVGRPSRGTPNFLADLTVLPNVPGFEIKHVELIQECMLRFQADIYEHHNHKRCPDQQPSAVWKNFAEESYQHIFLEVLSRVLIPLVYQAGFETFKSMNVDLRVLYAAVVDEKEEFAYVDLRQHVRRNGRMVPVTKCVPSEEAGVRKILSTSMPLLAITNDKTASIHSRRGFLQKHAESCSLGLVLNTERSVVDDPMSPVEWCEEMNSAHCSDADHPEIARRSSVLMQSSHHGLTDANAEANPTLYSEVQRRLRRLSAIGSNVVHTSASVEFILSHAHGGGIESAHRVIAAIMSALSQSKRCCLQTLLDIIDDVCGIAAFTSSKSLTPRNQSRINFFMWWRCLRYIFETQMVVPAESVPSSVAQSLQSVIEEFPDNSLYVKSQSRQKQDHHAHLMQALRTMATSGLDLKICMSTVVGVLSDTCGMMDVTDAVSDITKDTKGFYSDVDAYQKLKQHVLWCPLFDELVGLGQIRSIVLYESLQFWAREIRNEIVERGFLRDPYTIVNCVLNSTNESWLNPIWGELREFASLDKHPLIFLVLWSFQTLGFAVGHPDVSIRMCASIQFGSQGVKTLNVAIMPGTTNAILTENTDVPPNFVMLNKQVTIFAVHGGSLWVNFLQIAVWPDNPDDLNSYVDNVFFSSIALTATQLIAPSLVNVPKMWSALPMWMAKDTIGLLPVDYPVTVKTTTRPLRFAMPRWLFCPGMGWTWFECTALSFVSVTAIPIPVVRDGYVQVVAVYLARQNGGNEARVFVRPACSLAEVTQPVEQYFCKGFTDAVAATGGSGHRSQDTAIGPWAAKLMASGGGHDIDIEAELLSMSKDDGVYSILERLSRIVSMFGAMEDGVTEAVTILSEVFYAKFGLFAYSDRLLMKYSSATRYQDVLRVKKIENLVAVNQRLCFEKNHVEKTLEVISGELNQAQVSYDESVQTLCNADTAAHRKIMQTVVKFKKQQRDEFSDLLHLLDDDTRLMGGKLLDNSSALGQLRA